MPGFRQTVRLAEKLALVAFRLSPRPLWFMPLCVVEPYQREPACVASKVCQLGDCKDGLPHVRHAIFCAQRKYSCCCLLLMLSGEIYLRLKPYLVVKISSDIVTKHCCQVCVLSMMFSSLICRIISLRSVPAKKYWHKNWHICLVINIQKKEQRSQYGPLRNTTSHHFKFSLLKWQVNQIYKRNWNWFIHQFDMSRGDFVEAANNILNL